MKSRICFSLVFLALFCAGTDVSVAYDPNAEINKNCHQWQPADWDNYLENSLLAEMRFQAGRYVIIEDMVQTKCPENAKKVAPCLDRVLGYYRQFSQRRMYTGLTSDDKYLASQPQDMMVLPAELKSSTLPANWRDIANKKGWKYVLFDSNTAGSGRLVLYIPGKKYNRMVLYAGRGDPPSSDPTTYDALQMQAVETQKNGKPKKPKYHFKAWKFTGPNKSPEPHSVGGRCINCHMSGPRAIIPRKKNAAFPTELGGVKSLEEFNKLIVHNGPLDYSPFADPQYSPEHLQVGERERCTDCHNGRDRRSLAMNLDQKGEIDQVQIHRKVVQEQSMPAFED